MELASHAFHNGSDKLVIIKIAPLSIKRLPRHNHVIVIVKGLQFRRLHLVFSFQSPTRNNNRFNYREENLTWIKRISCKPAKFTVHRRVVQSYQREFAWTTNRFVPTSQKKLWLYHTLDWFCHFSL